MLPLYPHTNTHTHTHTHTQGCVPDDGGHDLRSEEDAEVGRRLGREQAHHGEHSDRRLRQICRATLVGLLQLHTHSQRITAELTHTHNTRGTVTAELTHTHSQRITAELTHTHTHTHNTRGTVTAELTHTHTHTHSQRITAELTHTHTTHVGLLQLNSHTHTLTVDYIRGRPLLCHL